MVRSNRGAISLGSIRASRGAPTLAKSLTVGALLGARLWQSCYFLALRSCASLMTSSATFFGQGA